jgi:hypothetical protein
MQTSQAAPDLELAVDHVKMVRPLLEMVDLGDANSWTSIILCLWRRPLAATDLVS